MCTMGTYRRATTLASPPFRELEKYVIVIKGPFATFFPWGAMVDHSLQQE